MQYMPSFFIPVIKVFSCCRLLLAAPLVAALVAAVMVATGAVQETSFSCQDRPYGYYADVEAECQVFHICNNNAKWSFRCPNQTLFNQVRLCGTRTPVCCRHLRHDLSRPQSDGKYVQCLVSRYCSPSASPCPGKDGTSPLAPAQTLILPLFYLTLPATPPIFNFLS
ncbi:hypothetical protein E2C01_003282 [Portunus trituberculatus]|uniref:Chitin-binding type-2 domain-containing protein n=1 Tax=Portunus trituberculatus TaxID=210409 RepID=A0A5B7CT53_PORTR|nr:hypothetical protein [Portunus trituberculatus]